MEEKTLVQLLFDELEQKGDAREQSSMRIVQLNIDTTEYLEIKRKFQQMEKEQQKGTEKFEYDFGYLKLSHEQLNKKLKNFGDKGWDILNIEKIKTTNELDSEGSVVFIYEVFMKRIKT